MSADSDAVETVALGELGLERGGQLLLKRALARLPVGSRVRVTGGAPGLGADLRGWCRRQGHAFSEGDGGGFVVSRGSAQVGRWRDAEPAGHADPAGDGAVVERPPARWGLAARGATVEAGVPEFAFPLREKTRLWTDEAAALYRQAVAAQWDPATAIPWNAALDHPLEVEEALVQVLTYLIENETAALIVPARFAAQVHPHFREVMQLLAVQAADEARHVEVFTRRATLRGLPLGLSTAGGQLSLRTLVDEPDFELASFLLSVLGEGSFLSLLGFLRSHAPDACTAEIMRLAAQDEARHVAFGLAHLSWHAGREAALLARLEDAVIRRHDALAHTAGLNEEVFDALVLLAAGGWEPASLARGHDAVMELQAEMDEARQRRLRQIGFAPDRAEALSRLHTRNFM